MHRVVDLTVPRELLWRAAYQGIPFQTFTVCGSKQKTSLMSRSEIRPSAPDRVKTARQALYEVGKEICVIDDESDIVAEMQKVYNDLHED